MATDFLERSKVSKEGGRVVLGTNQEASQFLQYNPRKAQEFKTHVIPKAGGKLRLKTVFRSSSQLPYPHWHLYKKPGNFLQCQ